MLDDLPHDLRILGVAEGEQLALGREDVDALLGAAVLAWRLVGKLAEELAFGIFLATPVPVVAGYCDELLG
ncbi:MAG TPA: hypothetical protein VKE94_18370 [Gemmataceae bacterium]|nr:hypothetical protein [Gemmataceae bacterium]